MALSNAARQKRYRDRRNAEIEKKARTTIKQIREAFRLQQQLNKRELEALYAKILKELKNGT